MAASPILREVATDNDHIKKRVAVLEEWAQSGELEPWLAVVLAELVRLDNGRGNEPTEKDFEQLFLNEELLQIMRDQVDGPWMVYVEQAMAQKSNNLVMSFLTQLEDAMGAA